MFLLLIVVPLILSKLTGRSVKEIMFGRTAPFKKGLGGKIAGGKTTDGKVPDRKVEKNSNRNDILDFVSQLVSFSRKHRFHLVFPGTLRVGEDTAVLTAVLITRSRVVGFSCYGYGGKIEAKAGTDDWVQTMNGERRKFTSPVKRNCIQEKLLKKALIEAGLQEVPIEVMGVFTAPKAELSGGERSNCFTRKDALEQLKDSKYTGNGPIDPGKTGKALESMIVRN